MLTKANTQYRWLPSGKAKTRAPRSPSSREKWCLVQATSGQASTLSGIVGQQQWNPGPWRSFFTRQAVRALRGDGRKLRRRRRLLESGQYLMVCAFMCFGTAQGHVYRRNLGHSTRRRVLRDVGGEAPPPPCCSAGSTPPARFEAAGSAAAAVGGMQLGLGRPRWGPLLSRRCFGGGRGGRGLRSPEARQRRDQRTGSAQRNALQRPGLGRVRAQLQRAQLQRAPQVAAPRPLVVAVVVVVLVVVGQPQRGPQRPGPGPRRVGQHDEEEEGGEPSPPRAQRSAARRPPPW